MTERVSAVNLLIDSFLPEEYRDPGRVYDKKGMDKLFTELARKNPELYPDIAKKIGDLGRLQAYKRGETFRLDDFKPVMDRSGIYAELDTREAEIDQATPDPEERRDLRGALYGEFSDRISRETNQAALARRNNIALTVLTGARGKEAQLRDLISTPGFYSDAKGKVIPWFIRNSFAEGLRPADFLASTYAARSSVTESKRATAQGGFLAKTLSRAAATHTITEQDCSTSNGIDLPVSEPDIRGRVLQKPAAGFPVGTVIDRKVLSKLKADDVGEVIVRSPMTCGSEHGICAKCFGVKAEGRFPKIGEHVGITAATALGEPLCLAAGTLVRMADWSVRRIEAIKPGEMVLGSDMCGRLTPVRVLNLFHNGLRPCVSTKVKKGHGFRSEIIELISTDAHKTLSYQSGRGCAKAVPTILPIKHEKSHHCVYLGTGAEVGGKEEQMADIVGLLIGDGCYNGGVTHEGIGFSCYDPLLADYADARLREYGMRLAPQSTPGEFRVSMLDQGASRRGVKSLSEIWHPLKKWLIEEGMWGQTSGHKALPRSIDSWDNSSVAKLIGGLLATDGWICRSKKREGNITLGFSSNSRGLLEGVKRLLELRFGIYGTQLCAKRKKKEEGYYDPTYEFCICSKPDVREFQRVIPVPGIKRDRLQKAAESTGSSCLSRGRYRVISQEPVGVLDTWDIEVDNETHLFLLANQLIVSNTQAALSMKHVVSGKGQKKEFSGLNYIQQFVESPEEFKDRSVVSTLSGRVEGIQEAPQGGHYVLVSGQKHYVPLDREITAEVGEEVEAGDSLTDGLVDTEDILKYKGLGEARNYWASRMHEMGKASAAGMDRRLFEVLARANVDHVQLDDPVEEGFLPDDTTRYSSFLHRRQIGKKAQSFTPKDAVGKWLEQPVLHHTVGTKITPKVAEHISKNGYDQVFASDEEPAFRPVFVRLQQVAATSDDWLASLGGSYLGSQLQQGITRAQDTNIEENIHPVPRLAVGVDYAKNLETTGKF